jgi:polyketide synthase PksN
VVIVSDRENALHLLSQAASGERQPNVFRGVVPREFEGQLALAQYAGELFDRLSDAGEETQAQVSLSGLADLHCQGYALPWERLYGATPPRRIALPTYPFARERYWVEAPAATGQHPDIDALHPLVQRNISTLSTVRFASILHGDEACLRDHRVAGVPTLPGVCHLEMVRAAWQAASDGAADAAIELRDVVWIRPLAVAARVEVRIQLHEDEGGGFGFEVQRWQDGEGTSLSQGRLLGLASAQAMPRLSIPTLQQRCGRSLDGAQCYARLAGSMLDYGPSLQGLAAMHLCDDVDAPYVLARLRLPGSATMDDRRYALHPAILDSALQAASGLSLLARPIEVGAVPFQLAAARIRRPTPAEAWARVRPSIEEPGTFDIDVADDDGAVCVEIRGLRLLTPQAPDDGPRRMSPETVVRRELRGDAFFLRDHNGVVPGVVYLEIARAAASLRTGQTVSGLRDFVWRAPLGVSDDGVVLEIRFDDAGDFVIATEGGATVCAQGSIDSDPVPVAPASARCDLGAALDRCARRIPGADCHALLGVEHGPRMFAIDWIACGDGEAIAKLERPAGATRDGGDEGLDASLLHGAVLAAVACSFVQDGEPREIRLPFALEAMRVHASRLPDLCFVHVRRRPAQAGAHAAYDFDLVDGDGGCLVSFEGFVAKPLPAEAADGVLTAAQVWETRALAHTAATAAEVLFLLPAELAPKRDAILRQWPQARIVVLDPVTSASQAAAGFLQVMALLQDGIRSGAGQRVIAIAADDAPQPLQAALGGLFRTAQAEHAQLRCSVVQCAASALDDVAWLRDEVDGGDGEVVVRYRHAEGRVVREVEAWSESAPPYDLARGDDPTGLLDAGDIVWITGGLGGIGRLLARWFGRIAGVRVVLSGRSELADADAIVLQALRRDGLDVRYAACDVADRRSVEETLAGEAFAGGTLRGIVHAAGVLRDGYLARKTAQDARAVLAPKIDGAWIIDEVTADMPLAFFALFSSMSAVLGNPGQADYAGANAFLDAFALRRNRLSERGVRQGHACSINWPLWKDGGMQVDAQQVEATRRLTGLSALDTRHALAAFAEALRRRHPRMLVAQGRLDLIRATVLRSGGPQRPPAAADATPVVAASADDVPVQRLLRELAVVAADILKGKPDDIDPSTELSHYGFDSIYLTEYANALNRAYGLRLMPTVFFECPTLSRLAQHLATHHGAQLASRWRAETTAAKPPAAAAPRPASSRIAARTLVRTPVPSMPSAQAPAAAREAIAVVGISGRFPGAADIGEFWAKLAANADLIREVPAERWGWMPGSEALPAAVRLGGFMDDVDCFDPLFFGIAPIEAVAMDPQQRLFIESAWACIEDAGYRPGALAGTRTGVFVGVSTSDYKDQCQLAGASLQFGGDSAFHFMIANRLSYLLDLHGPSESVDTACSSSLVAMHRAIGALQSGECELALVGGVNVIANPINSVRAFEAGILSSDGRCKTFDQSADGYGRGEGVAALMLKPLSKAEADLDHVYGLIRGSAENHGGRAASPSAPNPVAQQRLLVDAYRTAGIDVRTVGYLEAHGTGTVLGDPIEFNALKAAFHELDDRRDDPRKPTAYCAIGSVKTNIGHLEAAAGVAGVIKVLMMMRHATIPGNRHLHAPNGYLEIAGSPFYLSVESHAWEAPRDADGRPLPRRAGVSSFGIGGANAHIVLEEYRPNARGDAAPATGPAVIVLSAKTRDRLRESAGRLLQALERIDDASLHDLAYTLQVGREAFEHRLAFVADSVSGLSAALHAYLAEMPFDGFEHAAGKHRDLVGGIVDERMLESMVSEWISRGEYARLAELWAKGLAVDWRALHTGERRRRLSLPTYPFARERYWVELVPRADAMPAKESPRRELEAADGIALERLLDDLLADTVTLQDALSQIDGLGAGRQTRGHIP